MWISFTIDVLFLISS
uniref:Uncharacterized protein n=1 Tax=Arundo donax TaxID=35708 RepID=A0A0A9HNX4_ARUDO